MGRPKGSKNRQKASSDLHQAGITPPAPGSFDRREQDDRAELRRAIKGASLEERITIRAASYAYRALKRLDELSQHGQAEDAVRLRATETLLREAKQIVGEAMLQAAQKRVGPGSVGITDMSLVSRTRGVTINRDKAEALLRQRRSGIVIDAVSRATPVSGPGVSRTGHGPSDTGPMSDTGTTVQTQYGLQDSRTPLEIGSHPVGEVDSSAVLEPNEASRQLRIDEYRVEPQDADDTTVTAHPADDAGFERSESLDSSSIARYNSSEKLKL